jgi:hypothetical protein
MQEHAMVMKRQVLTCNGLLLTREKMLWWRMSGGTKILSYREIQEEIPTLALSLLPSHASRAPLVASGRKTGMVCEHGWEDAPCILHRISCTIEVRLGSLQKSITRKF